MIRLGVVFLNKRPTGCVLLPVLLAGVITASAVAEDRYFVMRDGRKVALLKSETELGVVFRSHKETAAAKARFKASERGVLEDVDGAPNSRLKLLRVSKVTAAARGAVRQDPAVREVGTVYRFAGSTTPVIGMGRIVVKLRADLSEDQRQQVWSEYQLGNVQVFKGLHNVYTTTVGDDADEVLLAERLAGDTRTLWAHPDFLRIVRPSQVAVSDPLFEDQWHLENTGQTAEGIEDADIDALGAWSIADGEGVLFGMFDDACDVDHEDLVSNYIGVGQDPTLSESDPGHDDPRPKSFFESHGTAVMGLAVASGNSVGVRGVSFRSRFTASRSLTEALFDTELASVYTFALEQGVDVHINSWGLRDFFGLAFPNPPVWEDAIETAAREGRDPDGEGGADPLGMVIMFSSGNDSLENLPGFDLSSIPLVLSVGASNDKDVRSSFSSFGSALNFLAPGEFIVTTSSNVGSRFDIDPGGKYTGFFGGTSAACPIAAGVVGLILSVNDGLTATDVRLIMEHTCKQISPDDADYNGITSRSLKYGYGRVNAHRAVLAAQESLANGNLTWPDIPADVRVEGSTIHWRAGVGTDDFLVVEAPLDFNFTPKDEACYSASQAGCDAKPIEPLPEQVNVLFVGCADETGCAQDSEQSKGFVAPEFGITYFAVYGRSSVSGRYSFGVPIDSTAETTGGSTGDQPPRPPAVTVSAMPREGLSPLTVHFSGNAIGDLAIDQSRTTWDFDVGDDNTLDTVGRTEATYTYRVEPGETRRFSAVLTMYDVLGTPGSAGVQIRVIGPAEETGTVSVATTGVSIAAEGDLVSDERCESDVVCGVSPFEVRLRIVAEESDVSLSVQSVEWDLGDGTIATFQSVVHTYINEGDEVRRIPVTVTVTFEDPGGETVVPATATEVITVLPGIPALDIANPQLPGSELITGEGGSATPCGALGLLPLLFGVTSLRWLRRRST